jgi:2-keto-4-pentenoate hydratase
MDPAEIAAAAELLWNAHADRAAITPLTDRWTDMTAADAYAVQLVNIERNLAAGRTIQGHKVGLSSKAMQQMLGVNESDYGHLLDDMFIHESEAVPIERFLQPRVEIEVAFLLKRPLRGPGATVADVLRATECVMPSIEIVDSRVGDWKVKIADTIADNASSGAVVLGGSPTLLTDIDVRLVGATLRKNGRLVETGASGAVLGNPAVAVAWLANKVADFGIELEEGHIIMPGSCIRMVPAQTGDVFRADFDRLGHVSVAFV